MSAPATSLVQIGKPEKKIEVSPEQVSVASKGESFQRLHGEATAQQASHPPSWRSFSSFSRVSFFELCFSSALLFSWSLSCRFSGRFSCRFCLSLFFSKPRSRICKSCKMGSCSFYNSSKAFAHFLAPPTHHFLLCTKAPCFGLVVQQAKNNSLSGTCS